ncbi:MAG: SUMF1/EgtB/PvdO family nonheme iron enzyme, partial [Anaerolineae bacterium]|nr:SUMF1/EgtB/PvdO family nonheme iron enzyme [Anaerolineae bacterium]
MKCLKCGTMWPDTFEFCPTCGIPIVKTAVAGSVAATTIQGENVVSGVQIIERQEIHPPGPDPEAQRRAYLRVLARDANDLPWTRVAQEYANPEGGESLGLAEVYTHLDTTSLERVTCEEELRSLMLGMARGDVQRIPAQTMVDQEARLLVLGDPGSGKSTFVNYLSFVLAQAGLADDPGPWLSRLAPWRRGVLLPVRVELREFAAWLRGQRAAPDLLLRYLRHSLENSVLENFWPCFKSVLLDDDGALLVLLDGLDEVPTGERAALLRAVQIFADRYRRHRYVVTCRPYAYVGQPWRLQGFKEVTLAPFAEAQVDSFVGAWYRELARRGRLSAGEADDQARRLQAAVRRRDLWGMAQRPLLLTVMTLLHTFRGQLPEDRTELYADAVDLLLRRWEQRVGGEAGLLAQLAIPELKISDLEAGLYDVAFRAHSGSAGDQTTADIDEGDLRKWLAPYLGGDWNKAGDFITYIRERAGLLVRHKTEAYTFPHRTFQEFMAACHLVSLGDYPREAARRARSATNRWREVFILAGGHAGRTHRLGQAIAAVNDLCPASLADVETPQAEAYHQAQLAGETLLEIGLVGVGREPAGQAVLQRVRRWLAAALRADGVLSPRERAGAGDVLARLGDPRFRSDAWQLPGDALLGFVAVPAGPFVLGTRREEIPELVARFGGDRAWYEAETPQQQRELPLYYIARYPVTAAQFRCFVQESGYKPATERSLRGVDTHPVVAVTWDDALAYCRWLTKVLRAWKGTPAPLAGLLRAQGWCITLPSELQWEKAARGPASGSNSRRHFPWGDTPDANRANYWDTGIEGTSAVGC